MRAKTGLMMSMIGVLAMVGLSACGSTEALGKTTKLPALVMGVQDGSPGYTENFNPLSVNDLNGVTYMFEPMYEIDALTGKQIPWLATSYHWVGTRELQFTIRKGVKWSNGKPFTAQDVVYTFDLLKQYSALDVNGIWSYISGVSASGNVVTFTFSKPNVPGWQYIATQVIVYPPQFEKVKNPVTFTDPNPIVTGPFILDTFNPSEYTLKGRVGQEPCGSFPPSDPDVTVSRHPAQATRQPPITHFGGGSRIPRWDWGLRAMGIPSPGAPSLAAQARRRDNRAMRARALVVRGDTVDSHKAV